MPPFYPAGTSRQRRRPSPGRGSKKVVRIFWSRTLLRVIGSVVARERAVLVLPGDARGAVYPMAMNMTLERCMTPKRSDETSTAYSTLRECRTRNRTPRANASSAKPVSA